MGKGHCTFKEADVTRAIRAAKKAGVEYPQVVIDLEHKTMTITPVKVGAPVERETTGEGEWDNIQ
jgi:hypothetical protein